MGFDQEGREMGKGPRRNRLEQDRYKGQVLIVAMNPCSNRRCGHVSRKLHLVRQRRGNDCGPAALATVAAYHGRRFASMDLANWIPLDPRGTNLLTLLRVAKRLDFRAHGVEASYEDIPHCNLPVIAHMRTWFGGHFVVLYEWTPTHVVIGDPAAGLRTVSRKAFCRRSTGYLLIIREASHSPRADPNFSRTQLNGG